MNNKKVVKGIVYLLAKRGGSNNDQLFYQVSGCELPTLGYATIYSQEIELPIPDDVDTTLVRISDLKSQREMLQQEANQTKEQIDRIESQLSVLEGDDQESAE
ncbi:hypothetical protein [Sansalvadorimonas verongulae]|uniref:hypothetical protein n=1 Tax=Sansalvadorimonas verongulae TaxID=2172824 RepID=UPI0012BB5D1A|nr:hypothetical protein [Sansalvadorimonas verongulae]MTI11782.1 hypothetical protein [Sansalvadorimonas verongulae]